MDNLNLHEIFNKVCVLDGVACSLNKVIPELDTIPKDYWDDYNAVYSLGEVIHKLVLEVKKDIGDSI